MISPQSTILSFASAGTGLPGADAASAETTPDPGSGADFAPWVMLALGGGTAVTPLPGFGPATALAPGQAPFAAGEEPVTGLQGGSALPAAVAGLPLLAPAWPTAGRPVAGAGLRAPVANVVVGPDSAETLAATPALDGVDETMQWTSQDDSIEVDLGQIELAKQLPEIASLRRHAPTTAVTGDGTLPDQSWHSALGEARGAAAATTPRGTAPVDGQPLPAPPANQAEFDRAVSQRMVWMLRNGHHDAQLKVHPAHLGSIDIQLSVDGDEARLSLTAASHVVRDALETAMPRLRELLSDAGLNLAQVNVGTGDRGHAGAFANDHADGSGVATEGAASDEPGVDATPVPIRTPTGIVDTFA